MKNRRRGPVEITLACLSFLALAACRAPAVKRPRAASAPRVLITIVIDQMAAWMAAERWPQLPTDGGFARLRREGLTTELRYAHGATDTAAGHTALYTGAVPRDSGVFANETLGPDDKPRSILRDDRTRLVDVTGAIIDRPGSLAGAAARRDARGRAGRAGAGRERVQLLAQGSRRAARGGAAPHGRALARRHGRVFRHLDGLPPRLRRGRRRSPTARPSPKLRAGGWSLDPVAGGFVAEHAETGDDQEGEGNLDGLGRVFPHVVPSARALRATPLGDRV